jgi:hypothetical protein
LATDKELFESLKSRTSFYNTELLDALTNITINHIGANMTVIESPHCELLKDCGGFLFVRDFYPNIFAEIRKRKRCVMIGNPGIGKSMFQYYYLSRLLNASKFEPLPPDCFGSKEPPKIVIRQIGDKKIIIYDLENRKAEQIKPVDDDVFECFNPKTTLYLMEPGQSNNIEPFYLDVEIPTLTTVSPNINQYKEFCKKGAVKLFMPCCTEDELKEMGAFLLRKNCVPSDLESEYSPDKISQRFHQFGGIIRHVLPSSVDKLAECVDNQAEAIHTCDVHALLLSGNIEHHNVSHFIMQYDVAKKGELAFKKPKLDFVSDDVYKSLKERLSKSNLDDKIRALLRNDETGFLAEAAPKLYEDVICELLLCGVNWQYVTRNITHNKSENVTVQNLNLTLDALEKGKVPTFEAMATNRLYHPLNPILPAGDILYKTVDGKLVIIQVNRQRAGHKKMQMSALKKLFELLKLTEDQVKRVKIVLVPDPSVGLSQILKLEGTEEMNFLTEYDVWQVPMKYREE